MEQIRQYFEMPHLLYRNYAASAKQNTETHLFLILLPFCFQGFQISYPGFIVSFKSTGDLCEK